MKTGIHPEYTPTQITCACGRVTETYATVDELHVEICSHCHPFFTGKQKLVDTAGRVERFRTRYATGSPTPVADEEAEVPAAAAVEADERPVTAVDAVEAGEAEVPAESTEA